MTSFLSSFTSTPASSSSHTAPAPQLEISITPSSSAYYTGETFSAKIRFRNAGPSHDAIRLTQIAESGQGQSRSSASLNRSKFPGSPRLDGGSRPGRVPILTSASVQGQRPRPEDGAADREAASGVSFRRHRHIGGHICDTPIPGNVTFDGEGEDGNAEAGPSRLAGSSSDAQEWLDDTDTGNGYVEPDAEKAASLGHARRSKSLALGGGVSPQDMVRALGGGVPRLPSRRPQGTGIPRLHPHSRQISIAQVPTPSLTMSDTGGSAAPDLSGARSARPPLSRMTSDSSTSSSTHDGYSVRSPSTPHQHRLKTERPLFPPVTMPPPPPPSHPRSRVARDARDVQSTCTIRWAYTRLVATFHPSNTYIPPDPLLPLRSLLLHQPIGSGTLLPSSSKGIPPSGSRWQMSFGTGTLPGQSAPSLTGSLVGLASSLLSSGQGGSLEQERKKVWNTKDLPVLETARSLIGVEIKLGDGEEKEYEYEMQVPAHMPPSHRGRAWTFDWKMVVNVGVMMGKEERVEEVVLPVQMWAGVTLNSDSPLYNVLEPHILQKDEARVKEIHAIASTTSDDAEIRNGSAVNSGRITDKTSLASLRSYAQHLLESTTKTTHQAPPSPGRNASPATTRRQRDRTVTGSTLAPATWSKSELLSDTGSILSTRRRARRGSVVLGDEDLVGEGKGGSAEAVELLSRHSAKSTFDIAKAGDLVAVLTLPKTTFRQRESILGVVDINHPLSNRHGSGRRVLKLSAYLESHETIPTALLPLSPRGGLSPQPRIVQVHAEFHAGYTSFNTRMSFEMDVPPNAAPGYTFQAIPKDETPVNGKVPLQPPKSTQKGLSPNEDNNEPGGLSYSLRLAFLVASPPSEEGLPPGHRHGAGASSVVPNAKDGDNGFFSATDGLAPVVPVLRRTVADDGDKTKMDLVGYDEMLVETVQCEIPVRVLPGCVREGEGLGVEVVL